MVGEATAKPALRKCLIIEKTNQDLLKLVTLMLKTLNLRI